MARVLGSRQGSVPCAKPTKVATLLGVSFSYSSAVNFPISVSKMAYRPFLRGFSGFCAKTQAESKRKTAIRFIGLSIVAFGEGTWERVDRPSCRLDGMLSAPGATVVFIYMDKSRQPPTRRIIHGFD